MRLPNLLRWFSGTKPEVTRLPVTTRGADWWVPAAVTITVSPQRTIPLDGTTPPWARVRLCVCQVPILSRGPRFNCCGWCGLRLPPRAGESKKPLPPPRKTNHFRPLTINQ